MKPEDVDRAGAQIIRYLATNVLTQEDALAVADAVLNDKGKELLRANHYFQGLDEK